MPDTRPKIHSLIVPYNLDSNLDKECVLSASNAIIYLPFWPSLKTLSIRNLIILSSPICRTNKVVKVTGGAFVPYDYLILCTGQQFQVPVPTGADISTLVTTSEVTMPKVSRYTGALPSSVFTITTERDCDNALSYIRGDFLAGQGGL